jgi:hypothetical protein
MLYCIFLPVCYILAGLFGLSLLILVLGFHKGNEITEHDPFMAYLWLLDVIFGAFFF